MKKPTRKLKLRSNLAETLWQPGMSKQNQRSFLFTFGCHCYYRLSKDEKKQALTIALSGLKFKKYNAFGNV
jgi:hypothetical protein